uniref:calcium-binding protein n=1 Tax=Sandarakinorhabdus sp. TaxID=1916663 RepID=UPI0033414E25
AFRITGSTVRFINTERGRVNGTLAEPAIIIEGPGVTIENALGGIIRATDSFSSDLNLAILGFGTADTVLNSGLISGRVSLGGGNDLFVHSPTGPSTASVWVELGSGDDRFVLNGSDQSQNHGSFVTGGSGFDTLELNGPISVLNGSRITGFERLLVGPQVRNIDSLSGFSEILLAPGSFYNFLQSQNPLVDLRFAGGFVTIGQGSSLRSVVGSDGAEQLELLGGSFGFPTLIGSADLGAGDDTFWITTFGTTSAAPVIGGIVNGGAGKDTLHFSSSSNLTFDLAPMIGFERVNTGTFSSATSKIRLINLNSFEEVTGDGETGVLTIAQSNSPNAAITVSSRGVLVLESTAIIGRYGFPRRDFFQTNFEQDQQGNDQLSVTVLNSGTILGDVQLYFGDDLYDGRDGTVGGNIFGYSGNDRIFGGVGDDRINGGFGGDDLFGGGGNDLLIGGPGGDILDGGDGFDYASYITATAGVLADLVVWALNTGEATRDSYAVIEGLLGSAFGDDLRGTGGDNWIYGGGGGDVVYGRAGNDVLLGENGDDTLWGNEGNDALYGGEGLDRLLGGEGADLLNGEGGFDFGHYDDATSGIIVDLTSNAGNTGGALGDQLFNVEGLVGSSFADRLLGDAAINWLYGQSGDDVLDGRGGDDVLIAGNGNDFVFGGDGNDLMFGEIGDDSLFGGAGNDRVDGGAGADVLTGGTGADVLIGNLGFDFVAYEGAATGVTADLVVWANNSGEAAGDVYVEVEGIIGSAFADSLRGDAGGNFLFGLGGDDALFGRGGNDVLVGGDGDDTLSGNQGDDAIYGGAGNDRIVFGAGDGRDALFDFAGGAGDGDLIQLAASLGITSFAQLQGRMTQVGGDTLISFDAATAITIVGVAPGALAPNDFLFG